MGGGAHQKQANIDQGLQNQALGPIVNQVQPQIDAFTQGTFSPQNLENVATKNAFIGTQLGRQTPGQANQNYAGEMNAARNIGGGSQYGNANQQNVFSSLMGNTANPDAQNAIAGLMNNSGQSAGLQQALAQLFGGQSYAGAAGGNANALTGYGSTINADAQNAAQQLSAGGQANTGARDATNNLLNFGQTQAPQIAASQNVNNSSNDSLLATMMSRLGGVANSGALATQMGQQGAQSNAQNSQALAALLTGENLQAQQAAGGLANQTAGIYNSALAQGGALGNASRGLQQGALESAGNLNNQTQNTLNNAWQSAGSLANQGQANTLSALQGAGSLAEQSQSNRTNALSQAGAQADTSAAQYLQQQQSIADIFAGMQGQQQGAQQNAYANLENMLGIDQNTLNMFLGHGTNAAAQYGQGQVNQQQQANQAQNGLFGNIGSLVGAATGGGGIGRFFGGGAGSVGSNGSSQFATHQ